MRLAVLAVLTGVTSPALAEDTCAIRVVKAPDDIREAIEARAGIESACTSLEVRVVKQRGTFQVTARAGDGTVHKGTAPDAGRIAELVMTWAAPAPEPVVEPAAAALPEVVPAVMPVERDVPFDPLAQHVVPEPAPESGREAGVGVTATRVAVGLRGEADILAWSRWTAGIALAIGDAAWNSGSAMTGTSLDVLDISAVAFVARTWGTAEWRLRAQAGVGVGYSRYSASTRIAPFEAMGTGDDVTPMIELQVAASRELSSGWAMSAGPMFTYYRQTIEVDAMHRSTRTYDAGAYLALRKRF